LFHIIMHPSFPLRIAILTLLALVGVGCAPVNDNGSGALETTVATTAPAQVAVTKIAAASSDLTLGERRSRELSALRQGFTSATAPAADAAPVETAEPTPAPVTVPLNEAPAPRPEVSSPTPLTATPTPSPGPAPATTTAAGTEPAANAPANSATPKTEAAPPAKQKVEETEETVSTTKPASMAVSLAVVAPGANASYDLTVAAGATVEAAMKAAGNQGFHYTSSGYSGLGSFVESINGLAQDPRAGMYWVYAVNGAKATLGISAKTLSAGDRITWTYEKSY
jgi:hypothetical protein